MTCKFVSREEGWQIEYWYGTTWQTLNLQDCSVAIKWSRLHRWCSKSSDHGLTETPWSTTTSCTGWTCQRTVSTPAAGWLPACKHGGLTDNKCCNSTQTSSVSISVYHILHPTGKNHSLCSEKHLVFAVRQISQIHKNVKVSNPFLKADIQSDTFNFEPCSCF